jgi:alginate O-acetyltransferase complex protein AlgI
MSLVFYAVGEPIYLFLMIATIIVDYAFGIFIFRAQNNRKLAKALLITAIILNLSTLIFFKYFGLITSIFSKESLFELALPIGISFYTFQALSYVIDVYKRTVSAQKDLIAFGTYVTLFPQLIAGPIVKYSDVDIALTSRKETISAASSGAFRFCIGLGKKVLLANPAGEMWETLREINAIDQSAFGSFLALIFFAFQIYFDFSGYSDMAIGLGKIFGFDFPENFNYPYTAVSITDFWRRWHITLSSWFREYVYISLGGNRCSRARMYLNLFCVWSLTGLWHGASWNFLLWGIYFFIILALEKAFLLKVLKKLPSAFGHIYALIFILLGWLIFAHDGSDGLTLSDGLRMLGNLFGANVSSFISQRTLYEFLRNLPLLVIMAVGCTELPKNIFKKISERHQVFLTVFKPLFTIFLLFISTAYLVSSGFNPFLYFRF